MKRAALCIGLIAAGLLILWAQPESFSVPGTILIAAGAALFARGADIPEGKGQPGRIVALREHGRIYLIAAAILSAVVGIFAEANPSAYLPALAGWALSMALFVRAWRGPIVSHLPRTEAAVMAGLFGLALALRVVALETALPVLGGDEANFAVQGLTAARGQPYHIFGTGWLSHPLAYSLAQGIFIKLMGPTVAAARLPSAIFGALAIPALYGLARSLYGRRVGVCAALILAGMGVHLHFSRLGMNNIVDPTLLIAALWAARRERWALAGVLLGAAQLFYPAARLAPVIALAALIFWRAGWRAAAITGAGMLIAAWPATWHLVANGLPLTTRLADVGLAGPVDIGAQIWRAAFAYVQVPDTISDASAAFYGGTAPLVGYAAAVPFLLGLGAARFRRGGLLIFWIGAAALFGGVLLRDPPAYSRYVIALPAAAMLIALGLRALPGIGARWRIALCAAVMAFEIVLYFGGHLRVMDHFGPKTAQLNAIARAVRDAEPGEVCLWRDPGPDDPALSSIAGYLAAGAPIPPCPIPGARLYLAVPARAGALGIFEDEAGEWVIYTDVRGEIVLTGFRPESTK